MRRPIQGNGHCGARTASHAVRLSISRMDGAGGARIGYVGMSIDITEILQARAEARPAAEKFAGAFTSAALGMALVSLEGRWLDVNDALCRILATPRGTAAG